MGVYATSSMPAAQLDSMHDLLTKVANSPQIAEKLRANGLEPLNLTRQQTEQRLKDEYNFMEKFLATIKLDFST
jgi:tripartite-type tricarboxylate transporter receptor subunit TctC